MVKMSRVNKSKSYHERRRKQLVRYSEKYRKLHAKDIAKRKHEYYLKSRKRLMAQFRKYYKSHKRRHRQYQGADTGKQQKLLQAT
jgi:hypothetical protein